MRKRVLILAMLALIPTMVLAAKDGIMFDMTLNPGKTYVTSKFYLQGGLHTVHMPINEVISPSKPQKVVIASFKYDWLGRAIQQKRVPSKAASGTMVAFNMPLQTKGNYNYQFAAYSNAFGGSETYEQYAGFKSKDLLIDSLYDT